MANSYKNTFTFAEKPATTDELLIAAVIEQYFKALKNRDVAGIISLHSKDAKVQSWITGEEMDINGYKKISEKIVPELIRVNIDDILIHVSPPVQYPKKQNQPRRSNPESPSPSEIKIGVYENSEPNSAFRATVSAVIFYKYMERSLGPVQRIWELEKINGQWLITGSEYALSK